MASEERIQGNKYEFKLKDEHIHRGIFISETKEHIYIKLESGYNLGISKKNIKSSSEIKLNISPKKKEAEQKQILNKDLPEIMILHTGGTIASKVDYSTGAVISRFSPEELLDLFPELKDIANISSRFISNMWSEDMNFNHYNMIAEAIKKSVDENRNLSGIIIGLGTDMLHYASAALSFMFEKTNIPIIFVGAQRSSDRPSTDSAQNIMNATYFITKSKYSGVAVCMHKDQDDGEAIIINGTNARKMHTSRRDAFRSINSEYIATVDFEKKKIEYTEKYKDIDKTRKTTPSEIKFSPFNTKIKIGLIKARPGLKSEELKIYEKYDGLILEGTGLGQFPTEKFDNYTEDNIKIFSIIEKIAKKNIVAMTSQTIHGRINMNVYSPAKRLKEAGVLGHLLDMTPETAYMKMAWLLSNYKKDDAKKLYSENLRGEISLRSAEEKYFE